MVLVLTAPYHEQINSKFWGNSAAPVYIPVCDDADGGYPASKAPMTSQDGVVHVKVPLPELEGSDLPVGQAGSFSGSVPDKFTMAMMG